MWLFYMMYIYIHTHIYIFTWVLYNMIYLVHLGHPHVLNGRTPATLPHCHIPEATLWSQLLCRWNWNQRLPPTAPWFPSWIPWSATPPIPAGRLDKGWDGVPTSGGLGSPHQAPRWGSPGRGGLSPAPSGRNLRRPWGAPIAAVSTP